MPYEARRQGPNSQQQQQQQEGYVTGSERGDFQEFQETLGRMAESEYPVLCTLGGVYAYPANGPLLYDPSTD